MKLQSVFLLVLLLSFFAGFFLDANYLISSGRTRFTSQVESYLTSTVDVSKERVDDFVNEIKMDVSLLAQSGKVEAVLEKEAGESREAAVIDVGGKVDVIAKEVENYLLEHPYMTLSNLQESREFHNIAIQGVAQSGYSVVVDVEDMEIYFHIDPKFVGMSRNDILKNSESVVKIFDDAIKDDYGSGFYNWTYPYGQRKTKYLEARKIKTRTADGVGFILLTTAYVGDYIVAKNVSEELDNYFEEFVLERGYDNVLFLSPEKIVNYMANSSEGLGIGIEETWGEVVGTYFISRGIPRGEVLFYGPFARTRDGDLCIMAGSSVYSGREEVGTIMVIKSIKNIVDILREENVESESYLIDSRSMLLTPLKSRDVDLLTQEIKTDTAEECLEDFDDARKLGISASEYNKQELEAGEDTGFQQFLDFKGDLVFGLERPIDFVHWCLLSEISVEEVLLEPMEKGILRQIFFRGYLTALLSFLIIIGSLFIDSEYVLQWKKRSEIKHDLFGRVLDYMEECCGRNIGVFQSILLGVVSSGIYFLAMTVFFKNWKSAIISTLACFAVLVISITIFFYGFRLKNSIRKFLFLGSGCLILSGPIHIFLALYWNTVTPFNNLYWSFPILLNAIGFFLLLIFFRGLYD